MSQTKESIKVPFVAIEKYGKYAKMSNMVKVENEQNDEIFKMKNKEM